MTRLLVIGTLLLGFAAPSSTCIPTPPPQGLTKINIWFEPQQTTYFCVPACIKMWAQYYGRIYSQQQIWDFARNIYPEKVIPGQGFLAPSPVAQTASWFLDREVGYYFYTGYPENRRAVSDQAAGLDGPVKKTTLVPVDGNHTVLFTGASWHGELPDLILPRADFVTVHDPDIGNGGRAHRQYSLYDWILFKIIVPTSYTDGGTAVNYFFPEQYSGGTTLLDAFDAAGGTFDGDPGAPPPTETGRWKDDGYGGCYWEPNDSGPDQCAPPAGRWKDDGYGGCYWDPNDSGPDQCAPEASRPHAGSLSTPDHAGGHPLSTRAIYAGRAAGRSLWALLRPSRVSLAAAWSRAKFSRPQPSGTTATPAPVQSRGQGEPPAQPGRRAKEPSGRGHLPKPGGTSTADVLANLKAGLRSMRMTEDPVWGLVYENLDRWQSLKLSRVIPVTSLYWACPDYFIVAINDVDDRPYADAIVSAEGWLLEWGARTNANADAMTENDVTQILLANGINAKPKHWDYVYAPGMTGSLRADRLRPMARLLRGGHTYYVARDGNVYEETHDPNQAAGHIFKLGPKVHLKKKDQ